VSTTTRPGATASVSVPEGIAEFLGAPTPPAWVEAALARLPELVVDHANCERKAAANALSLMTRYPDRPQLVARMSRLAREELRHFEQVQKILLARGWARRHVRPARYAQGLRNEIRRTEPQRLVDHLLVGAFIEARSCERFALLAPRLAPWLGDFYRGLLASEARHYRDYLALAERYRSGSDPVHLSARVAALRVVENRLVTAPDEQFQFHSGPPSGAAVDQPPAPSRASVSRL
jgi:tRNA-(ms[2]io[6]A)-hydroxylase